MVRKFLVRDRMVMTGLIILGLLLDRMSRQKSFNRTVVSALSPLIISLITIFLISFALYLPMLSDTVSVAGQNNQFRLSDVRHAAGNTAFAK